MRHRAAFQAEVGVGWAHSGWDVGVGSEHRQAVCYQSLWEGGGACGGVRVARLED